MSTYLIVPIRLDALCLQHDRATVEATADFSRLPYTDGQRDYNADIANISEEIASQPFENRNLHLKAGIHLHWALPDALTKGVESDTGSDYPPVPNRWYVIRTGTTDYATKEWIVESDYLHPEGTEAGGVSVPVDADPDAGKYQPFRYLGRTVPLEDWSKNDADAEYLDGLTAIGYGEPAFAAFYPNCHSVFGFYDEEITGTPPSDLSYKVLGLYGDPDQDWLKTFVDDFNQSYADANDGAAAPDEELIQAIEDELGWTFALEANQALPKYSYYYGSITFDPADTTTPDLTSTDTTVTVGNTPTEALSAYLAHTLDADNSTLLEDQLESLYLSSQLGSSEIDTGAQFEAARHENGFTAVDAGALWTITGETSDTMTTTTAQVTLPDDIADALNELNALQAAYNRSWQEIDAMRTQMFSDWYKYMICAYPPEDSRENYPDIDQVSYYLKTMGGDPITAKELTTGMLYLLTDDDGKVTGAATDGSDDTDASRAVDSSYVPTQALVLVGAINDLLGTLTTYNSDAAVTAANTTYVLKQTPDDRYWRPNEPAVLMTGPDVEATQRHGQDGLLECVRMDISSSDLDYVTSKLETAFSELGDNIAANTWQHPPWNPFLLEWEVELFPIAANNNLAAESRDYAPELITDSYTLPDGQPDLVLQDPEAATDTGAYVYRGSSILTNQAETLLQEQLEAYLNDQPYDDYFAEHPNEERTNTYITDHIADIAAWYASKNAGAEDPVYTAIRAYQLLSDTATPFYSLAQALGGFNDALLMHKQTLQLSVADPLGFADYQEFATAVAAAVQDHIHSAPTPLNDFSPVRSGNMKLLRLRLVDTFGQIKDLDLGAVSTAESMANTQSTELISLPPRLVQPARLSLRWRSADHDDVEMNAQPATTPVCGWLLPNRLDNSLAVYDTTGQALGSLNPNATWQAAPGSDNAASTISAIANAPLRQLLATVQSLGESFLSGFILTMDNAAANIEPDSAEQHQGMALLVGRPVALVRTDLNLELQGLPAVHQGWNAFRQDLQRDTRDTDNIEQVQFPVRIGEPEQLNDGLIGYWIENADGTYEDNRLYSPATEGVNNANITAPANVCQTLDAAPHTFAMLMDPRGTLNVTSGVLPIVSISIPPDQYADALAAIEVTFLTTPLLTNHNQVCIPLPDEPGYSWTWLQQNNGEWTENTALNPASSNANFDAQQELREGWLKLSRNLDT